MQKVYSIFLDSLKIGTTQLEKADASMGVVFGVIKFNDESFGYDFLKNYCQSKCITLAADYPDDKMISTSTIDALSVKDENGVEIKGLGNQISGMDGNDFEVYVEGIAYPFYETAFPHHVKAYQEMHGK
ncbi:hypothetical protein QWY85_07730 [Neolewinella lacunae]|uniref:Uncharacterized protein n=1 Tax=Neolewinella lacunae TaxID=1517758 RepID=A0A923PNQ2_9BACT|nr:hypothetical protein [Neolewinella lacunae]MBC6994669.1 hypothetical protein [Neolewinella lacunae]MDN3634541.1 hypothetical protein [Neolewinella lacunae]